MIPVGLFQLRIFCDLELKIILLTYTASRKRLPEYRRCHSEWLDVTDLRPHIPMEDPGLHFRMIGSKGEKEKPSSGSSSQSLHYINSRVAEMEESE